jgi:hypothetical protein
MRWKKLGTGAGTKLFSARGRRALDCRNLRLRFARWQSNANDFAAIFFDSLFAVMINAVRDANAATKV